MVTLYSSSGPSRISIILGCLLMAAGTTAILCGLGIKVSTIGWVGVGLFYGGLGNLLDAWR